MSRLTRDGTVEPVSRDQILRHARGLGNIHFPCSADDEQDWQPYAVDPYSAICDDHTYTYIHTYIHAYIIHTYIHTYIHKRKKPLNSCRRQGGNGGDFGGTRKRCRKGSVGPAAANSNIVEINKEAGGGAQGTLSLSKNCTSRESVSPLSRLIRGFRNKYH